VIVKPAGGNMKLTGKIGSVSFEATRIAGNGCFWWSIALDSECLMGGGVAFNTKRHETEKWATRKCRVLLKKLGATGLKEEPGAVIAAPFRFK